MEMSTARAEAFHEGTSMTAQQPEPATIYRCTTFPDRVVLDPPIRLVVEAGKIYQQFKCSACGCFHRVPR